MFSIIAGESPTDSSERCYYDDGLASFVFGLYDGIGPLKINLSKEREKIMPEAKEDIDNYIQCLYFSRPQSILLEFGC